MIAIHNRPESFSDRWLAYCREHGVPHQVVDARATDIIAQLRKVAGFLWHWPHWSPTDQLYARQLIQGVEALGIAVYPNTRTCWHYDDKIAQKYLLEALGAPLVPSRVFFEKERALEWIAMTTFPKVFKLRSGAGSSNVRLARTRHEAEKLCRVAFGRGFKPVAGYFADLPNKLRLTKSRGNFGEKLLRAPSTIMSIWNTNRMVPRQKGYVYFQDFMPGNTYDTRVTIIGRRAFAFRRGVRPGDFRASGSGLIDWTPEPIDMRCVTTSIEIARRVGAQSLAFDYVQDLAGDPRVLEISYAFAPEAIYQCPGWWDEDLNWHDGHVWPEDAILEDILDELARERHGENLLFD